MVFFCSDETIAKTANDELRKDPKGWRKVAEKYNEKMVVDEIHRLNKLYQQLAKSGYQPHLHMDGHIRGKYVTDGRDWVFLVTAGSHRMAALAELGYEWITARIQPHSVKVIDLARPNEIPVVHSGLMKQQELHNFYQPYLSNVSDRFPQRLHMS